MQCRLQAGDKKCGAEGLGYRLQAAAANQPLTAVIRHTLLLQHKTKLYCHINCSHQSRQFAAMKPAAVLTLFCNKMQPAEKGSALRSCISASACGSVRQQDAVKYCRSQSKRQCIGCCIGWCIGWCIALQWSWIQDKTERGVSSGCIRATPLHCFQHNNKQTNI